MLVFCTFIYVHIVQELSTETVLGEHTLYYTTEQLLSTVLLSHDAGGSVLALTTGITRVGVVDAIRPLLTSEAHLVGVDNNHVVTTVHVRSKVRLLLTTEEFGNLCSETAKNLVGSIHYDPFLVHSLRICRNGLVT